jgi:hypothetical protein
MWVGAEAVGESERGVRNGTVTRCLSSPCACVRRGQVLLLPNFTMCVTREMRSVDGYDTIELLEQVRERECLRGLASAGLPARIIRVCLKMALAHKHAPALSASHPLACARADTQNQETFVF